MSNLHFFIDFDGTITTEDVVDKTLGRFASPQWQVIEKEWVLGKIGSRECLSKQMALVRAPKKVYEKFLEGIKVDPYFTGFLRTARELSVPVTIVSDGFDFIIHRVLKRVLKDSPELLEGLDVYSNGFRWTAQGPRASFNSKKLCEHGCANCKPAVIAKLVSDTEGIIFVGDGYSDRFAAKESDLCFAKGRLLSFCRKEKVVHRSYKHFGQIEQWLRRGSEKRFSEKACAVCTCCA